MKFFIIVCVPIYSDKKKKTFEKLDTGIIPYRIHPIEILNQLKLLLLESTKNSIMRILVTIFQEFPRENHFEHRLCENPTPRTPRRPLGPRQKL